MADFEFIVLRHLNPIGLEANPKFSNRIRLELSQNQSEIRNPKFEIPNGKSTIQTNKPLVSIDSSWL
jgi:hypothetical protein